jgi:hypothetical protein
LNQEDINHLNRSKTQNEIEAAIKSLNKECELPLQGELQTPEESD